MKAAIIGAGFISAFHAEAYRAAPNVQLCAVCDTDSDKAVQLANKMHCNFYLSAEEMLKGEKPDLVSICLPTFLHEHYSILSLQHGANVLCEKPMSLSYESCLRMADTAANCGKILMIGQVLRWWPEYVQIREQCRRLGIPQFVYAKRMQHLKDGLWINHPQKGGGVLYDLFIHDLDFCCSLFGSQPSIESIKGTKGSEKAWRSVRAMLSWSCGALALIEASNQMPANYPFSVDFRAEYEKTCLQYSFRAPYNIEKNSPVQASLELYEGEKVIGLPLYKDTQSAAFNHEIADFAAGVAKGVSPLPVEETLSVMKTVGALKKELDAVSV